MSPPPSTKTEETFDEKANRLMQKLLNNETLTTEELEFLATPHPGMNQLPRDRTQAKQTSSPVIHIRSLHTPRHKPSQSLLYKTQANGVTASLLKKTLEEYF